MPIQYRTGHLLQTVQDDKHATGWCYTMLWPVRNPPESSDPAGYAKTKKRNRKRKKKKEKGVKEMLMGE